MPRPTKGARLGSAAGSPYYYLYWTEDGRQRRRSTGTEDLRAAQRQLAALTLKLDAGINSSGPKQPESYAIAKTLEIYLRERAGALKSAKLQIASAEKLIKFFGDATVDHVTKASINAYIRSRRSTPGLKGRLSIADATIRRELAVLQAALNHCAREGLLTRAPYVHLPKQGPGRSTWLDHEEAAILLDSMGEPHVRLFSEIALYTGARKGAILELRWEQIDFSSNLIYLNPAHRVQTSKRRATVPMASTLHDILIKARERATSEHVIEYRSQRVKDIKTGFGAAVKRAADEMRRYAEKAKSDADQNKWAVSASKMRQVTPHVLRHTAGSWMAQAGVPLGLIAAMLGHTETKTTALYAHMQPDYLRPAVDAITKRLGGETSYLQVAGNEGNSAQTGVNNRQSEEKTFNKIKAVG